MKSNNKYRLNWIEIIIVKAEKTIWGRLAIGITILALGILFTAVLSKTLLDL